MRDWEDRIGVQWPYETSQHDYHKYWLDNVWSSRAIIKSGRQLGPFQYFWRIHLTSQQRGGFAWKSPHFRDKHVQRKIAHHVTSPCSNSPDTLLVGMMCPSDKHVSRKNGSVFLTNLIWGALAASDIESFAGSAERNVEIDEAVLGSYDHRRQFNMISISNGRTMYDHHVRFPRVIIMLDPFNTSENFTSSKDK